MFNFVGGFTISSNAKFLADFYSVIFGIFGNTIGTFITNVAAFFLNFLTKYTWEIFKWIMAIVDAMQLAFMKIIGIDTATNSSMGVDEFVEGAKGITITGGSSYYDYIMKIFRAVFVVAIILMIVFTIYAMIKQDYDLAMNGYSKADNKKGKFIKVLLSNIMIIFLLPLIFYTIIAGSSAILTSFYRAYGTASDVTVAGNVLASASYDANRYRAYANSNKRIPITISVYSMENIFGMPLSDEDLKKSLNDPENQEILKAIGGAFANNSFLPFEKSTLCESGTWTSYKNYSITYNNTVYDGLGDYFENFICTREQYYVMADFIDYCQLYNIKYYIKAMSEPDICWKYVDGITAEMADDDGNAIGDITLNIKYRDAKDINMENYASANIEDDGSYELQITTKIDYTSPISDALKSASKLLGIDADSSKFNTMERDDSGDFTNLVSWSTEKVLLQLSDNFDLENPSSWTYSDQIIIYEYFRFQADGTTSNNTLKNYTLEDLKKGVTVDAREMTYRNYNSNVGAYSDEIKLYCVKLNNTYYRVECPEKPVQVDEYGHPYYLLKVVDKNVDYFNDEIVSIEKDGTTKVHLSSGFSINDSNTWDTLDQILIYEYFKDLSLSNEIVRKYQFTDFIYVDASSGVTFNTYKLNGSGSYIYINGTYYQLPASRTNKPGNFLADSASSNTRWFGYNLSVKEKEKYGIDKLGNLTCSPQSPETEIDDTDAMYQRYASMNFRLSEGFSFYNSDTWTFRDYAIIHLYCTKLKDESSITVESLKHIGLNGSYNRDYNGLYFMKIKVDTNFVCINMEELSKTSELKITQTLAPEIFKNMNLGVSGVNLLKTYNADLETERLISESAVKNISTHTFNLSVDFDAYDAKTWTVGDYLMLYLVNVGIIETSLPLIKLNGYTSLVYKIGNKNYYRFGREGDPSAYILDESLLSNDKKYDVDKWFETNLMQFLLIEFYSMTTSDIALDASKFDGGISLNKDQYIYDISSGNYSSTKSLQYYLADQIFKLGISITDTSKIEYTYSNPELNPNDITTWNYLDLLIYQKTGMLPSIGHEYTSNVYFESGNYYFLVKDQRDSSKDVFVNISNSSNLAYCYSDGSGKLMTNQVFSGIRRSFASKVDFNNYYSINLRTTTRDIPTHSDTLSVYYYSENIKGPSSEKAEFEADKLLSDLDMVLVENQVNKNEKGYYIFNECEIINDILYIKIADVTGSNPRKGVYLAVSQSKYDKIYYANNSIIPSPFSENVFNESIKDFSVTPPEKLIYKSFATYGSYSKLDALIYSITGSATSEEYQVYEYSQNTGIQFIKVNNNIIKYETSLLETVDSVDDHVNERKEFLYNTYYRRYVSEGAPIVSASYSGIFSISSNNVYSGLNVILEKYGITTLDDNENIKPRLILAPSGDYYLSVNGVENETTKEIFINLSSMARVDLSFGQQTSITLIASDSDLAKWRLYNTKEIETTIPDPDGGTPTTIYTYETRVPDYLQNLESAFIPHNISLSGYVKDESNNIFPNASINVDGVADRLNFTPTETNKDLIVDEFINSKLEATHGGKGLVYTYANLLSVYLDPRNICKELDLFYSHIDEKVYVVFESGGDKVLIPYTLSAGGYTVGIESNVVGTLFSVENVETSDLDDLTTVDDPSTTDRVENLNDKVLGKLLEQKNYLSGKKLVVNNSLIKDEFNNDLVIFLTIDAGDTDNMFAVCGIKNDTIQQVSTQFQYLYVNDDDDTIKEDGTLEQAEPFIIQTNTIKNLNEWTMLDFIISYVTETTQGAYFSSIVCKRDGKYYIKSENQEKYIYIPEATFERESDILGKMLTTSSEKLISDNLVGTHIKQRSMFVLSERDKFDEYEANLQKNTDFKGEKHHIRFSEHFDIRNTTTWTISDYILYYICTNGYYSKTTSLVIPFTYIPSFERINNEVSNLTYFDLFLADAYKNSDSDYTPYFNSGVNKIYRFNIVRDSSYTYYVEIKENYHVKLSDYLYTNYAKMELKSPSIGESFTILSSCVELTNKINTLDSFIKTTPLGSTQTLTSPIDNGNFQTLANSHGTLGYVQYLFKVDEKTGSVELDKVIEFDEDGGKSGTFFVYDKFFEMQGSSFSSYAEIIKENELDIEIKASEGEITSPLKISVVYDQIYPDFKFKNYYYFNEDFDFLTYTELKNVDKSYQGGIIDGTTSLEKAKVNLKLSEDFDHTDSSTWTVIDYIIMREYARENVNHNKFKDLTFDELKEDTFVDIYINRGMEINYYMYLNGGFYNLKGYIQETATDSGIYVSNGVANASISKRGSAESKTISQIITPGVINNHSFRVLFKTNEFVFNSGYNGSKVYTRDAENISYTIGDILYFKYIDVDIAYANYRINVSRFGKYSTEILIKKSSWVEKLMTDMQVYYPDLNWGTLIATDGWLDTLGDFTSAYSNGLFIGGGNSSNTTAAGLVLSEFFMSVATETDSGYADYEYSSVFDEETIKSLMLSLMGEENYKALVFEAKVFMDYFNSSFAPIIDDFADEFGESVGENSLRLNAYKSYLATLLLSSDIGEYLYTIATRIYAEYTIGEYLAAAGGDYSGYYGYVNLLKDEDGNLIDSYNYGTFEELIIQENKSCGKSTPTFTFSVEQAFERYGEFKLDTRDNKYKWMYKGKSIEDYRGNETEYKALVREFYELLDEEYAEFYEEGYKISESGKVIDAEQEVVRNYEDQNIPYFYMLHVYWDIVSQLNFSKGPSYLQSYREYMEGTLSRWSLYSDVNADGAEQYYEYATAERAKLELYRILTFVNVVRVYCPTVVVGENDYDGIAGKLLQLAEAYTLLDDIFGSDPPDTLIPMVSLKDMIDGNIIVENAVKFVQDNSLSIYFTMGFSQDSRFKIPDLLKTVLEQIGIDVSSGVEKSWNKVLEFKDNLDIIIEEIKQIRELLPGEVTDGGSNREYFATGKYYINEQIDYILASFQDLRQNVTNYVAAQERLDRMDKRSITFTLAQYGANYVSTGYEFSVRNKDYTFKNNVDPSRIAEYVYGGAFLESVGVGAQYTDPEFEGIVHSSKIYDPADKVVKTHLVTWPELRGFASNFADKTAELYFLTNLKDLDVGKTNGINFDSTLNESSESMKGKIVEFIKSQFVTNLDKDVVAGTSPTPSEQLISRITGGSTDVDVVFERLSLYIFSNKISKDKLKNITFEEYKRIAMQEIIDNEQNGEESAEERANRYMTLFNLLSVSFEFTASDSTKLGSIVRPGLIKDSETNPGGRYNTSEISATMRVSNSTLDIVKTMSGLENRPTHEVLTREYGGFRAGDYYDESYGDTFIACTYKNGLYYPILASGSKICNSAKYQAFYSDNGFLRNKFTSEYLQNDSYVIVAKGIITPDGNPTAIRKYNNPIEVSKKKLVKMTTQVYNPVTYYRTNIGGSFAEGENLIDASRAISRVTTKNYTKYVYGTNFSKGIGSTVTYTGRNSLKTIISSDYKTNFVQSKVEYLTTQSDEFGGISVLDEFSYFYVFSGESWILLTLAFITIIPVMFNAVAGVITRLFDLIILFIVSPLVISANSLYASGKNEIYKKWKKTLETVLWSALGYIIGFSSFTIMVPTIYNVKSYVDVGTYESIIAIGGLGKFIKYPMLNALVKNLWMITTVTILEKIPKLLLPILTANNGDVSSPHPGLADPGKPMTKKIGDEIDKVSNAIDKMQSLVSGRAAKGFVESAKSTIQDMVPGYEYFKEKSDKKKMERDKKQAENEEKIIESLLVENGFDSKTAKAAGQAVKSAQEARQKAKEKDKKTKEKYKKEFQKLFK